MAAKKNVEENVKDEEFFEEEVVTDELTSDEAKATTENSKKEGFIKKGWNGYKASFKAHPVKTFIKTIAVPAAFVGGVFTGKAVFGAKTNDVVDVTIDALEDVVEDVIE